MQIDKQYILATEKIQKLRMVTHTSMAEIIKRKVYRFLIGYFVTEKEMYTKPLYTSLRKLVLSVRFFTQWNYQLDYLRTISIKAIKAYQ